MVMIFSMPYGYDKTRSERRCKDCKKLLYVFEVGEFCIECSRKQPKSQNVKKINHLIQIRYRCNTVTLKARFNGKCVECNDPIKKGKEIVKNSKGVWVHKHCSDVEEELP